MKKLQNVFAAIKTGLLAKATSVTVIGSKRVFEILSRFENEGLIRGFQIIDISKNKVSIYLKYKQDMTSLLSKIKVVSVNKEKLYIKGKLLKKLNTGVNMYFVESKFGLQTLPQLKIRNKRLYAPLGGEIKYIVEINKVNPKIQELIKKKHEI
ncbi:ribosomal protein S8 (mitochondrion) [Dictyostelium discoideum]|uniref:Small ribosomal subunit protein uS8m n=1 Tax=Dictyostelium discoideum TaxID=44689 RepID=RT08_DICDI|nr:ribosomal protein S8 [Dictyostelium discoideum]O21036.1 RecName: Full=Small ribosomal subunit protein uS8m; AltName: Full=Ribosomal protein S8, mitochondrial [Dictyostelium discoideum]BAA23573.1 ribosomal protein S8 [Dictyostelium discoideum]BAA78081.1 ribosomal protein S8 [Dictyostelium discoideum]|eukprot:NP_050099.1 ribosomal protein S8 (mitochondrion) [Dictyostelium discoideum]